MTARAVPLAVVTVAPSPITRGWWLINLCAGKNRRPIGFATSHSTAIEAGSMLAQRFGARFAPVGRIAQ